MYDAIMRRMRWVWAVFALIAMAVCAFQSEYVWAVLFGSCSAYYAWRKDSFMGYGG